MAPLVFSVQEVYSAGRSQISPPLTAVVPIADLELLQALEDLIDVHEAKAALDEARATGTKPLDRLMAELEDRSAP